MVEGPRSASSGKRPKGPGWAVVPEPTVPETKGPPPCALALDPRRLVRDPGNNTRGSAAEIQGAGTTIDGPSTMPTGACVNTRGQGSELKAPVPSFLQPRNQDAAPWPTVQSRATVGGLGLATFAARYNAAWLRQRHGHKAPKQIRAEHRGLATNVATGLKMAA